VIVHSNMLVSLLSGVRQPRCENPSLAQHGMDAKRSAC
jgi:hypothetical protein